jgi:hypothetical protein
MNKVKLIAYKVSSGTPEEKRQLGRPTCRIDGTWRTGMGWCGLD